MSKVLILHSPLEENAPADELDVLEQAEYFKLGLEQLGYNSDILPFPYDILSLQSLLFEKKPVFVVNLVETLFSNGRLLHLAPFLFEHFKIPYTGSPAASIYNTSDKVLAKKIMQLNDIKSPAFFEWDSLVAAQNFPDSLFIVKSLWEHASFGMDESKKMLFGKKEDLMQKMNEVGNPKDFFAEEYIHGREFNISMIAGASGPMVLPVAEIQFHYPHDKPRIVGYRAKWDTSSFEYANTIRSFDFKDGDKPLLSRLRLICLKCWEVFALKGYARVDFRVDEQENIYVLEINANPCISPDSGFVAATQQAGINHEQAIDRIIKDLS